MPPTNVPPPRVAGRRYTVAMTCCVDDLAHDVTDENALAGQRAGVYQAVCGHRVVATALAAPAGRPCMRCTAMTAATQPTAGRARRGRRWAGWLWRMLHPGYDDGGEISAR